MKKIFTATIIKLKYSFSFNNCIFNLSYCKKNNGQIKQTLNINTDTDVWYYEK